MWKYAQLIFRTRGLHTGFTGFDLKAHTATIFDTGDAPLNSTILSDVAKTVVGILNHPSETANRYVYVQTVKFTQNELLAALEKSTGEKFTVSKRDSTEARQIGGEKLGKGDLSGLQGVIFGALCSGDPAAEYDENRKLDNDLLGVKQVPLQELVDKIVKGQAV